MPTQSTEDLGLETTWLEHEPETILEAKSYLEDRNFVVHICTTIEEAENWVLRNGYDMFLTDLHFQEGERDGPDLLRELKVSEKPVLIVPVSAFLKDYRRPLSKISKSLYDRAIDKATLDTVEGIEDMRQALISYTKGGRIRVIERCSGFVEEEVDDKIVVCVKMPDETVEKRIFPRKRLYATTAGKPGKFLEITTVERYRGETMVLQTICRWLYEPE